MTATIFDPTTIHPVQWATVRELADGSWRATWDVVIAEPSHSEDLETVARRCNDPALGFVVVLEPVSARKVRAVVITPEQSQAVEYYAPTYRMFQAIDARLGQIETIQGVPRSVWKPFRDTTGTVKSVNQATFAAVAAALEAWRQEHAENLADHGLVAELHAGGLGVWLDLKGSQMRARLMLWQTGEYLAQSYADGSDVPLRFAYSPATTVQEICTTLSNLLASLT